MMSEEEQLQQLCEAVAEDLRSLAQLHDHEPLQETFRAMVEIDFPHNLGLRLESEGAGNAIKLMEEALVELGIEPDANTLDWLAVDYADIYLNHALRASPYESVWFDDEGLERQAAMFQVRDYYRRHELTVKNWEARPEDHLVHQLEFIAFLFDGCDEQDRLEEAARFMDEHLLRWMGQFAVQVVARAGTRYFAALALLTEAYVEELRQLLVELMGKSRPSQEEIEARMREKSEPVPPPSQFVPGAELT